MASVNMIGIFNSQKAGLEMAKAPEPAVQKPESTGDPMKDHIIKLSELAKKMAKEDNPFDKISDTAVSGASNSGDDDKTITERMIEDIKEKIKRAQQELKELQNSDIPEDVKRKLIMQKQSEITQLQSQLTELQKQLGNSTELNVGGNNFMNTGSLV